MGKFDEDELTEVISVRITKADRALIDAIASSMNSKPLTVARLAMRRGLVDVATNPATLFQPESEVTMNATAPVARRLSKVETDILRAVARASSPKTSYAVGVALGAHPQVRRLELERALQILWHAGYVTKLGAVWQIAPAGVAAIGK